MRGERTLHQHLMRLALAEPAIVPPTCRVISVQEPEIAPLLWAALLCNSNLKLSLAQRSRRSRFAPVRSTL